MKVAIVGATGAVGREMIAELEASQLKHIELELYASPRSEGLSIEFRGKNHVVKAFTTEQAGKNQFILMSAGGDFSKKNSKALVDMGAVVIDNSSAWRMDKDIPLIVPEVNSNELINFKKGIIANPNCSTIQMVLPLKAIEDYCGIEMVNVATYQSVSGTGQQGLSELTTQIEAQYKFQELEAKVYPQPIAFNVLSSIGGIDAQGHCQEEEKMVRETRKILNRPELEVFATTARVPVLNCHCEAVLVKCKKKITQEEIANIFSKFPGMTFTETSAQSEHPSPRTVVGDGGVFVNRLRLPLGEQSSAWLQFWVVADNLKKGAATNAVQILERLV